MQKRLGCLVIDRSSFCTEVVGSKPSWTNKKKKTTLQYSICCHSVVKGTLLNTAASPIFNIRSGEFELRPHLWGYRAARNSIMYIAHNI